MLALRFQCICSSLVRAPVVEFAALRVGPSQVGSAPAWALGRDLERRGMSVRETQVESW